MPGFVTFSKLNFKFEQAHFLKEFLQKFHLRIA